MKRSAVVVFLTSFSGYNSKSPLDLALVLNLRCPNKNAEGLVTHLKEVHEVTEKLPESTQKYKAAIGKKHRHKIQGW